MCKLWISNINFFHPLCAFGFDCFSGITRVGRRRNRKKGIFPSVDSDFSWISRAVILPNDSIFIESQSFDFVPRVRLYECLRFSTHTQLPSRGAHTKYSCTLANNIHSHASIATSLNFHTFSRPTTSPLPVRSASNPLLTHSNKSRRKRHFVGL